MSDVCYGSISVSMTQNDSSVFICKNTELPFRFLFYIFWSRHSGSEGLTRALLSFARAREVLLPPLYVFLLLLLGPLFVYGCTQV